MQFHLNLHARTRLCLHCHCRCQLPAAVCHALQCLVADLQLAGGEAPTVCSNAPVVFTFTATSTDAGLGLASLSTPSVTPPDCSVTNIGKWPWEDAVVIVYLLMLLILGHVLSNAMRGGLFPKYFLHSVKFTASCRVSKCIVCCSGTSDQQSKGCAVEGTTGHAASGDPLSDGARVLGQWREATRRNRA